MPIKINTNNTFVLETQNTSYAFGVDSNGLMQHIYFGKRIEDFKQFNCKPISEVSTNDPVFDLTPEEFSVQGGLRYKETSLGVEYCDGVRDCVYTYKGYEFEDEKLIVNLEDEVYKLNIQLIYTIFYDCDVIQRQIVLINNGTEAVLVERVYSLELTLPFTNLNLTNVSGHWGSEHNQARQPLKLGKCVLENRKGISTHNNNPYFILDADAKNESGDVYFGALAWSGNFKTVVEVTPYGNTHVLTGLNDYDFMWELEPGQSFSAPKAFFGFTGEGFDSVSHKLHKLAVNEIMPAKHKKDIRPVLYNSWEATEFNVNIEEQKRLAKIASELGIELFVIDDGWFGERNSIFSGLGDWHVNQEKFPDGLKPLSDMVHELGMKFGLWLEPEMVNPDSDLFRQHPDWIYHYPTRKTSTSREQYVINITRDDVKQYIIDSILKLVEDINIDYIKWDANRPISEPGAFNLPHNKQRQIWYSHIQAVYEIADAIREKYPDILLEACASGGGRTDFGALEHFDDFWTSDNTDAFNRLSIHHAYSYIYPIKAMRAWVTDTPNFLTKKDAPLEFRFNSAMMGSLGVGSNILNWTSEVCDAAKNKISQYKQIRHIIQEGKFYRLINKDSQIFAFQYVLEKESVLFVFAHGIVLNKKLLNIKLKGIDGGKTYFYEKDGITNNTQGAYLINKGIDVLLTGDYFSEIIYFKEE